MAGADAGRTGCSNGATASTRTLPVVLPEKPSSGLVVLIPAAEPAVGLWRDRLDPSAAFGVGAHVTVLAPFAPPELIDDVLLTRLQGLFANVPSFSYTFDRTAWFEDLVLWLAPTDDRPFRRLTEAVQGAFPQYPPFEGVFADPTPHLTVGHEAAVEALREAEFGLAGLAPIRGRANAVTLLEQTVVGEPLSVREVFRLG